jgi:hypothetical protein
VPQPGSAQPQGDFDGNAGDVFLLAPIEGGGAISKSYLLVVESELNTRELLTELLGDGCRVLEVAGEEDAFVFLRDGVEPSLLLVQLRISAAEAWVLADVIREYPAFGATTITELPGPEGHCGVDRLAELLELCTAATKTN